MMWKGSQHWHPWVPTHFLRLPSLSILLFTFLSMLLLLIMPMVHACKVVVKVEPLADEPFKFKIHIPAIGKETEEYIFEKGAKMMKVLIEGNNCYSKHWNFMTWRRAPDGKEWVKAKEGMAKIDGMGEINVNVLRNLQPVVGARFGVTCSESLICG